MKKLKRFIRLIRTMLFGKRKNYVFFIGGKDAEMEQIKKHLVLVGAKIEDLNLGWGAKASAYGCAIIDVAEAEKIPVLIELAIDMPLPKAAVVIDHHGQHAGRKQSLLQVLDLLELTPSREDALIALNDEGYIPALVKAGATSEEIEWVRSFDRLCQGITSEQEMEAERAVSEREELINGLVVVRCAHSKTAAIADRMVLIQKKQNLLILSADGESNYYGRVSAVKNLDKMFPGGWTGGLSTEDNAFWGGCVPQEDVYKYLSKYFFTERFGNMKRSEFPSLPGEEIFFVSIDEEPGIPWVGAEIEYPSKEWRVSKIKEGFITEIIFDRGYHGYISGAKRVKSQTVEEVKEALDKFGLFKKLEDLEDSAAGETELIDLIRCKLAKL